MYSDNSRDEISVSQIDSIMPLSAESQRRVLVNRERKLVSTESFFHTGMSTATSLKQDNIVAAVLTTR